MYRRLTCLLVLVLALALIVGCGNQDRIPEENLDPQDEGNDSV